MKLKSTFLVLLIATCTSYVQAQGLSYVDGKEFALAETKQVTQFFGRFNGLEDYEGNRLSKNDTLYTHPALRQMYITNLFDKESNDMHDTLKNNFIRSVTNKREPKFLYHKKNDWYAQVDVVLKYEGKEHPCTVFLKMERENKGTKWVLANVYFRPFTDLFKSVDYFSDASSKSGVYIHPKSHEMRFINLKQAFDRLEEIEEYAARDYNPDYLTLFIYELKKGNAEFVEVKNLKFHFFQLDNWYFEVSSINRKSMNSGWLITDLMRVAEKDKEILRKYIFFHENSHTN